MNSIRSLPIGVFDSGVGGLTVAGQIRRLLPGEDLIYLGDTARVPYGTKSPETVVRFACEDARFLVGQGVKAVVVACNTASAWALAALEARFSVPVFGVIQPGALQALEKTRNLRIGVIGTNATIRSKAYERAILERNPEARVFTRSCPLLVPMVEEGWLNHAVTLEVLRIYLAPLLSRRVDTLVLGCTHYPLLKRALRKVVGQEVSLIDSAGSCAMFVREQLAARSLLAPGRSRPGWIRPFVTDEAARFEGVAARFLGFPTEPAQKAELSTAPFPV